MTDDKKTPVADHIEQTLDADSSASIYYENIDADIDIKDLAGVVNTARLDDLMARSDAFANHLEGEIEDFIDDFEDDYKS